MKKNGKAEPLDLHVLIEKEGRLYSALCLELDVASQGRTIDEAQKNIVEAVELYLQSVYADGDKKEFIPRPAPIEEWLKYLKAWEDRPVVVTKRGKPVAVLLSIDDDDELERLILAHSPKFQAILNAGKQQIRETGGIRHEDFWQEVEAES